MTSRVRRSLLLISAAILALVLVGSCGRFRHHPNVLIITIDTLRADHLGCYGMALARTPNIDRIASEGVRCSNAVSAAPITMPSHTSIMTGLLPPAHGVRDNGAYALGNDAVTLAERLRDSGYTTHAFVSALVLNRRYNLNQGFESYDDDLWAEDDPRLFMIRERPAPKTADRFLAWLDSWRGGAKRKPFFTWIHFFDPHQPYKAAPEDSVMAASPYDAEISGVDRQVGRIVATLKKDGLLEDTLLVITADHGESLGEHGEMTHAIFVYDATVHVPMIWRYPNSFKPRVYDAPVRSIDIVPTVLSVLGLPGGEQTQGMDLARAFAGKVEAPKPPQYSESLLSEVGFGMAPLFAIRDQGYKFIRAPRPELYDLRNDPGELHNLVTQQPDLVRKLDGELSAMMADSRKHAIKVAANPMTHELEESLQALGYLAPHGERASMDGIDPKDGLPLHNEMEDARHFAQRKQWGKAEGLLRDVMAKLPRNVSAMNILGLIGVKTGDSVKAREWYGKSLAVDPTQFRVYSVLGSIDLSEGKIDEGEKKFKKSVELNPNFAEAIANIGFAESMRGDQKAAEQWYQKGIAADPTFPRVYRRLGDLYFEKGDYAHAYDYYKKVYALLPSDFRAYVQAGTCARRLGRPAEAETLFVKAQQLRPDSWVPEYDRACLAAATGKPEVALQLLNDLAKRGKANPHLIGRDVDLVSVRGLPQFAELQRQMTEDAPEDDEDAAE